MSVAIGISIKATDTIIVRKEAKVLKLFRNLFRFKLARKNIVIYTTTSKRKSRWPQKSTNEGIRNVV